MSTSTPLRSKLTIDSLNSIVTSLKDPIRGFIFIEVLRNPEITANDLKHRMNLKGSKIYFHINKLIENDILEFTGTEKFEYKNQNLSRKKIKVKNWILKELIINNNLRLSDELLKIVYGLQLHLSIAVLDQQIRKIDKMSGKQFAESFQKGEIPLSVFSFVDQEIVTQISSKITELVEICNIKYDGKSLIEVMKACNFGVITGIFPLN
jgi:predicted transcriptional regulator